MKNSITVISHLKYLKQLFPQNIPHTARMIAYVKILQCEHALNRHTFAEYVAYSINSIEVKAIHMEWPCGHEWKF